MLATPLMRALNFAIETALHADPRSAKRLQALNGKVIAICLQPFNLTFYGCIQSDDFVLSLTEPPSVHATISGTPLQLASLSFSSGVARHRFFSEGVTLTGDAELAQQIMHLFDALTIDWEELTSQCVGDVPAYRLSQAFKGARAWLHQAKQSFVSNVDDYLHEETTLAPHPVDIETFMNDVDTLSMDTERFAARLQHLIHAETSHEIL